MSAAPAFVEPYAVSAAARAAYVRDGHVVLRGVAEADEVARFAPVIEAAVVANKTESRPLAQRDLYSQAFLQTMNLWEVDGTVAELVLAPRFAGIAAALLGVDRVRLYHDQALFKEPGGGIPPGIRTRATGRCAGSAASRCGSRCKRWNRRWAPCSSRRARMRSGRCRRR
ncbi:phytanoyl-CoA dioxygenase family protein [Nostocoides jenkinsii]|uniref:Uncharacterized protein n=1 Tax=Nostocoides jenkinsii Ben 74 TaxID=1193518 RepID=A0A077MD28_9MICO|nr:phytanoyl-CoA dioxygenase family protein [Tetrasphaera jenkinsii]CCI52683.1 hypothetical protein BN13_20005 [Tetrasphaera jenkinsii Ben 74]